MIQKKNVKSLLKMLNVKTRAGDSFNAILQAGEAFYKQLLVDISTKSDKELIGKDDILRFFAENERYWFLIQDETFNV